MPMAFSGCIKPKEYFEDRREDAEKATEVENKSYRYIYRTSFPFTHTFPFCISHITHFCKPVPTLCYVLMPKQ